MQVVVLDGVFSQTGGGRRLSVWLPEGSSGVPLLGAGEGGRRGGGAEGLQAGGGGAVGDGGGEVAGGAVPLATVGGRGEGGQVHALPRHIGTASGVFGVWRASQRHAYSTSERSGNFGGGRQGDGGASTVGAGSGGGHGGGEAEGRQGGRQVAGRRAEGAVAVAGLGAVGGVRQGVAPHGRRAHRRPVRLRLAPRGDGLEGEGLADLLGSQHPDEDLAAADGDIVRDLRAPLRLQAHVPLTSIHTLGGAGWCMVGGMAWMVWPGLAR